mmetsp:Transcript_6497/g.14946  ORF Transcript_6497/g.14946 Transcript_6497/m.14946 type:complete len:83 (-) Transcript_6497:131-379(-)
MILLGHGSPSTCTAVHIPGGHAETAVLKMYEARLNPRAGSLAGSFVLAARAVLGQLCMGTCLTLAIKFASRADWTDGPSQQN